MVSNFHDKRYIRPTYSGIALTPRTSGAGTGGGG